MLPAAGSWDVEVYEANGLVPIASGVAKIDVPLVITSVSPSADLNQLGGDVLTIIGTGFDTDMTNTSVVFSDSTKCDVHCATATEIKCTIAGFDLSPSVLNTSSAYTTTITVNSVSNSD